MHSIEEPSSTTGLALWNLGFRPFFLAAAVWALLSVALWTASYVFGIVLLPETMPASLWHGHAMVFGYAMAVVAGFLLTAVKNWTGSQTPHGAALMLLFGLWLAARILPLLPLPNAQLGLQLAAGADLLFGAAALLAVIVPVWRARQWAQLPVVILLSLLVAANAVFWLASLDIVPAWRGDGGVAARAAVYGAVSLLAVLIAVMGRRVIPFFIERGSDDGVVPKNFSWVDRSALPMLIAALLLQLWGEQMLLAAGVAALAAFLMAVRVAGWAVEGLGERPLLWILVVGYAWLPVALLLLALTPLYPQARFLALHALAYGLLGSVTLGMMARVTLGHTGREVLSPPGGLNTCFGLLTAGAVARVLLPLADAANYPLWVLVSQLLWMAAFGLFLLRFGPMFWQPRVDGRFG